MLGFYPGRFWKYCWKYITPAICAITFIISLLQIERLRLGDYVYPWYAEVFGWLLALSSFMCVPIYALYMIITNRNNLKKLVTPEK